MELFVDQLHGGIKIGNELIDIRTQFRGVVFGNRNVHRGANLRFFQIEGYSLDGVRNRVGRTTQSYAVDAERGILTCLQNRGTRIDSLSGHGKLT